MIRVPPYHHFPIFSENKYLNFEGIILISSRVFYIDIENYNFVKETRKKFLFLPLKISKNLIRVPPYHHFPIFSENKYLNFEGIIIISSRVFNIDIENYNFVKETRKKFNFIPL